ncbi:hypothetical protein A2U01_0097096, partial [Trifolium medium]|nr:hypothetical protein [Trifolium medium]
SRLLGDGRLGSDRIGTKHDFSAATDPDRRPRCEKPEKQDNTSSKSGMGRISGRRSYLGTRIGDAQAISAFIL